MIIPFIPEDLFELNENIKPEFDGKVLVLDNVFKNFNKIQEVTNNMSVENWKISPSSRNFNDYYDCRVEINNFYPDVKKLDKRLRKLTRIAEDYFNLNYSIISDRDFSFNYFKHNKKNIPTNLQHCPHYDPYLNVIFYLDDFKNGGTAIYKNSTINHVEIENIMYDVSNLEIEHIIESKPNRCVIFNGEYLHGGYIKDHNIYYDNWRINMVHFFRKG